MLDVAIALLAATLIFGGGFALGYAWRGIRLELLALRTAIKETVHPQPPQPERSTSVIVDPDDPVARAKYEREQIMRGLNPERDE